MRREERMVDTEREGERDRDRKRPPQDGRKEA